ncbi:MAG: putative molybdenum carrier protein [Candidatus Binatia bacterium]
MARAKKLSVRIIVSGGQTGVDRAALDVAKEIGLECGGWCPKGRLAEDGRIPDDYPLRETETTDYAERTELNVRDSDGTLIFTVGPPLGGTAYTITCARRLKKPYCVLNLAQETAPDRVQQWLEEQSITILNVAGPRLSQSAAGYALTYQFLLTLLSVQ